MTLAAQHGFAQPHSITTIVIAMVRIEYITDNQFYSMNIIKSINKNHIILK